MRALVKTGKVEDAVGLQPPGPYQGEPRCLEIFCVALCLNGMRALVGLGKVGDAAGLQPPSPRCLEIAICVAVVTSDWIRLRGPAECLALPYSTIV